LTESDDIRLANVGRPQLQVKPYRCERCGVLASGLGKLCDNCMNRSWWRITLERQHAILQQFDAVVDLAYDPIARAKHIALIGQKSRAFCGAYLTQKVSKRIQVPANKLPDTVCPACAAGLARARHGDFDEGGLLKE